VVEVKTIDVAKSVGYVGSFSISVDPLTIELAIRDAEGSLVMDILCVQEPDPQTLEVRNYFLAPIGWTMEGAAADFVLIGALFDTTRDTMAYLFKVA